MTYFQKTFIFLALLSVVGFCFTVWNTQSCNAQTKPLTYPEVITALNSKLPNRFFKNKIQLVNYLITQIKKRKVDNPLINDREEDLRHAGATDALITAIRQNSPPLPTPTPTNSDSNTAPLITNSIQMRFVYSPAGTFQMGSANGESDEKPVHTVRISQGFYMGLTEVTQAQWVALMGSNPSKFKNCDKCPVESVSWEDVQEFIRKLNAKGEGTYRLPTEAEWEYAARAGTTGDYAGDLDSMAWYSSNSEKKTHEVETKQPNGWGLYDMHGNVWEWVEDWYGSYPSGSITDPTGATSGSRRVNRGGSWSDPAADLRLAYRFNSSPSGRYSSLGFRVVRTK